MITTQTQDKQTNKTENTFQLLLTYETSIRTQRPEVNLKVHLNNIIKTLNVIK